MAVLATTLGPTADDRVNDLFVYRTYADYLGDGLFPYRDVVLGYPPLALVPLGLGGVLGTGEATYAVVFGLLMLVCGLAVQRLTALLAADRGRMVAWLLAFSPLLFGAMVRTHFDLVPVAFVLAALLAFARERPLAGFALLGLGTMTKVFPAVLVPVALVWLIARGEPRAAWRGVVVFLAVCALVSAPFFVASPRGYLDAYTFHNDRPVQIESTPASVLFALGGSYVTGTLAHPDRFASNGLDGGAAGAVQALFTALLLIALALAVERARAGPDTRSLVLASFAALLAFVALGKVLSPQFMFWLVPFAALAWMMRARLPAALTALAVGLTQLEFPARYFDLVARDGGVIVLVAARNAALIGALIALLAAREAAPARSSPRASAATP